eukprot:14833_1
MYNVDAFICTILDKESEEEEQEEEDVDKELQCAICLMVYASPVRNIQGVPYCHSCIVMWFNHSREQQLTYHDPKTNVELGQYCRLLIPDFGLMTKVWHFEHSDFRFTNLAVSQLNLKNEELDSERRKLLQYLQRMNEKESINVMKIVKVLFESNNLQFNRKELHLILEESFNAYQTFCNILKLIQEATEIYNSEIRKIFDNRSCKDYIFNWNAPKWDQHIDKNAIDQGSIYQVDEYLLSQIETQIREVVNRIYDMLQNSHKSQNLAGLSPPELKEKVCSIILSIQSEQSGYIENEQMEQESKKSDNYPTVERIFYAESNGLVNTNCIREITNCIIQNKPFELYNNALNHKMDRGKLIRFLQTGGMNGNENEYFMHHNFAMKLKHKLETESSDFHDVHSNTFDYWNHLQSIDIINPRMTESQSETTDPNTQLKVIFEVDIGEHLALYNGNKQQLCKMIKQPMIKHLHLELINEDIIVQNIVDHENFMCIDITFSNGLFSNFSDTKFWFEYNIESLGNEPNYYNAIHRAITQSILSGGNIGVLTAIRKTEFISFNYLLQSDKYLISGFIRQYIIQCPADIIQTITSFYPAHHSHNEQTMGSFLGWTIGAAVAGIVAINELNCNHMHFQSLKEIQNKQNEEIVDQYYAKLDCNCDIPIDLDDQTESYYCQHHHEYSCGNAIHHSLKLNGNHKAIIHRLQIKDPPIIQQMEHVGIPIKIDCHRNSVYCCNFTLSAPYNNNYTITQLLSDVMNILHRQYRPIKFVAKQITASSFIGKELNDDDYDWKKWNEKIANFSKDIIIKTGLYKRWKFLDI